MKRSFQHYMVLADIESPDFARLIGESTERVSNWVSRDTPVFVEFDLKTMVIDEVFNKKVIYRRKGLLDNTDAKQ